MFNIRNHALASGVAASLALLLAHPASAADAQRSVYQNAGATCHGEDNVSESMLERSAQRLRNKSRRNSAFVVCNLPTDFNAVLGSNFGQVTGVGIWGKRFENLGTKNDTLSCTLVTGYADDTYSDNMTLSGAPLPLAPANNQVLLEFTPTPNNGFFLPVNLVCELPPRAELNDWYVSWKVNVGN